MISTEFRTVIDSLLRECFWDHYVGQPKFDAMLMALGTDELDALASLMTDRARLILAELPIDNPPDPATFRFRRYIDTRMAHLNPQPVVDDFDDDVLDELDKAVMAELAKGYAEMMDTNPWD